VPTAEMPEHPSLDSFRRQARALQRAVRDGDPAAVRRLGRHHPGGVPGDASGLQLSAAQLVVAREYGFTSWTRLRRYLDTVAEHGWETALAVAPAAGPAGEFCRLACLTYGSHGQLDALLSDVLQCRSNASAMCDRQNLDVINIRRDAPVGCAAARR